MNFFFRPDVYRLTRFARTSTFGAEYADPIEPHIPPPLFKRIRLFLRRWFR